MKIKLTWEIVIILLISIIITFIAYGIGWNRAINLCIEVITVGNNI